MILRNHSVYDVKSCSQHFYEKSGNRQFSEPGPDFDTKEDKKYIKGNDTLFFNWTMWLF